ncbi:MAG: hypothetical protein M9924_21775 [Rhizobiaceae bacterium]|nr:hypothetical protein [Rhizobiaceae bacterium]
MSGRGVDYVDRWIGKHVNLEMYERGDKDRPRKLAEQCLADAAREGIVAGEITEELGDLARKLGFALEDTVEGWSRD